MKKENRFKEMVLYIEACESGSMFRNVLPNDMNIFVTTAASFNESSYACYLDETRNTYLGDCYSVNWMEDTDKEDIVRETLYDQFLLVKKETNESHVKSFGDMKIARLPVADFQGEGPATKILYPKAPRSPVPSHDVPLQLLIAQLSKYNHAEIVAKYKSLIKKRRYLDKIMKHVVRQIADNDQRAEDWLMRRSVDKFENLDCFTDIVHSYSKHCFNLGRVDR
uniref:Legumain n=1 Tax=Romanomermis culicivorax TaxID=13658 RepID=A0A915KYD6_ROMCU